MFSVQNVLVVCHNTTSLYVLMLEPQTRTIFLDDSEKCSSVVFSKQKQMSTGLSKVGCFWLRCAVLSRKHIKTLC